MAVKPGELVSTRSRPKAAGFEQFAVERVLMDVSTHQPPEGGWEDAGAVLEVSGVFQHTSRLKAAGKLEA